MSRSYKKTPYAGGKSKWHKRWANRSVRRKAKQNLDISFENNTYRKHYESWNIYDWEEIGVSFNEHMANCWRKYHLFKVSFPNEDIQEPNIDEEYSRWMRWYRRK